MSIRISQIDDSLTKPRLSEGVKCKKYVGLCDSVNKSNVNKIGTVVGRSNANDCISFKGSIVDNILKSPLSHSAILRAKNFPLLSEAIFALVITCGLRPATIMATAGKDESNRKKCKMQVAKSFATGLVGLGTTILITNPLSYSINKISGPGGKNLVLPERLVQLSESVVKPANQFLKDNAEKLQGYVVKNMKGETLETTIENIVMTKGAKEHLQEFSSEIFSHVKGAISAQKEIAKYRTTMPAFLKKIICPVFSPAKSVLTISLVPIILGLIFKNMNNNNKTEKKDAENKQVQNTPPITNLPSSKGSLPTTTNINKSEILKGGQI